jgi:hypothetical protein
MIGADDDLSIHRLVPRHALRPNPCGGWIDSQPRYWEARAQVRDWGGTPHDQQKAALYRRIAAELEAGKRPADIAEIREVNRV